MPIQVLLVEDSPGDVRLTQEAFRDANPSIQLHVATDGVEAMAFLRNRGASRRCSSSGSYPAGSESPQNGWPGSSGSHQGDSSLKTIPTVILTTSDAEADIVKSYQLPGELLSHQAGAVGCVREPGEKHQRFLADQGQVAAAGLKRMTKKSIKILLLVEDNPGDARLLREMLNERDCAKPN